MAAVLQLIGVSSITAGAWFLGPAAGLTVGGFFLVLIGVAVERGKRAE
jgi:hypothetical protein